MLYCSLIWVCMCICVCLKGTYFNESVCVCVCVCVWVHVFTQYPVVRASKELSVLSYSLVLLTFFLTDINDHFLE